MIIYVRYSWEGVRRIDFEASDRFPTPQDYAAGSNGTLATEADYIAQQTQTEQGATERDVFQDSAVSKLQTVVGLTDDEITSIWPTFAKHLGN